MTSQNLQSSQHHPVSIDAIQQTLQQHSGVDEAYVLEQRGENPDSSPRLFGYFTPHPQTAAPIRQILQIEQEATWQFVEWTNGMTIAQDYCTYEHFLFKEIFELDTYRLSEKIIPEKACIFDVGANIGVFSLFIHCKHPGSMIYAFEPVPSIFNILQLNMNIYNTHTTLFCCGLSREAAQKPLIYHPYASVASGFFTNPHDPQSIHREDFKKGLLTLIDPTTAQSVTDEVLEEMITIYYKTESITCPTRTISDVIDEYNVPVIDLLKIDAEGSELDILHGIREEHWSRIKQMTIEVHGAQLLEDIEALLKKHNYQFSVETNVVLPYLWMLHARQASMPVKAEVQVEDQGKSTPFQWSSIRLLLDDIRGFMSRQFPASDLPCEFIILDAFPRTDTGQIDVQALPHPKNVRKWS